MSATHAPQRIWYSPAVRTLIAELGIDPATINGTGRGGRVTRDDMLAAWGRTEGEGLDIPTGTEVRDIPPMSAASPSSQSSVLPPQSSDLIPLTRIRRMTAENLTRTIRTVPMERAYVQVDWTALMTQRTVMRAAFAAAHGVPLTFMPFILRGMAIALHQHPAINSRWTPEGPERLPTLNIGVAVSTDAGLQVPVVHHAGDLSLVGLARALHRVITAARDSKLTLADIQGGTVTITNPGPFGTVISAPIIPPNQSAILSVDGVRAIPVAHNGALIVRSVAFVGLTYDTRLIDEGDAAPFLATLRAWLEGGFIHEATV